MPARIISTLLFALPLIRYGRHTRVGFLLDLLLIVTEEKKFEPRETGSAAIFREPQVIGAPTRNRAGCSAEGDIPSCWTRVL